MQWTGAPPQRLRKPFPSEHRKARRLVGKLDEFFAELAPDSAYGECLRNTVTGTRTDGPERRCGKAKPSRRIGRIAPRRGYLDLH
jgi:hypothetical protein